MEYAKTYHTFRFSTLTINFSEVWPRQILELGKQFNLMIRLRNILKASLQDVLQGYFKMFWRRIIRLNRLTSSRIWRCLEDVFADVLKMSWRRLHNILKTSWRCLEDVFARRLDEVFKMFWRRLGDIWPRRIYWSLSRRLLKTND